MRDEMFTECTLILPDGSEVQAWKVREPEPMDWYPSVDCVAGMVSEDA